MALLGQAALVIFVDVAPDAVAAHDDWHTHEHFPERLSIPGFQRGSRWVALSSGPRYFILYEVSGVDVLTSEAYLERLNHPTPWTAKIMQSYRGMARGFCRVQRSFGLGTGQSALVIRFGPAPDRQSALRHALLQKVLPGLTARPGLASAHLLESAVQPEMTAEQQIRGRDAALEWVLLVTGYDAGSVMALSHDELRGEELARHGAAPGSSAAIYQLEYSLSAAEIV